MGLRLAAGNRVPAEPVRTDDDVRSDLPVFDQVRVERRLPVGADVHPNYGSHFRVWAPRRKRVEVVVEVGGEKRAHELTAEPNGYFSGFVADARHGTLYRYRLDGGDAFPDPASRFQPEGPHGPSQVVDPSRFTWTDGEWKGVTRDRQVIYELHVGTFTHVGTWAAASAELGALRDVGITMIEVMPVADFAGTFGWGYDGVDLYAPTRLYGEPDDFRRFVDRAHALGIAVILDVVYNHFGPDGNYVAQYSDTWFSDRYKNEWGDPLNFDAEGSVPVREFFIANAGYWIDEYHLDGLRLDATQQIFDASEPNIVAEIVARVRTAGGKRGTYVVAENEPQESHLARPVADGGFGMDALWNDDFHHSARVAMTGRNEAYFSDYLGTAQELVSAVKHGFLYQGQRYSWQKKRRGTPSLDLPPPALVHYIQNHDQIANAALGMRLQEHTSPGRLRAMTALVLLGPQTPMLFQGQEFAASAPFHFFADHHRDLAEAVRKGRMEFMSQFRGVGNGEAQSCIHDPSDRQTFEICKLDLGERKRNAKVLDLHRDLLRLRREDGVLGNGESCIGYDGAVLGDESLLLRFFADDENDRLLVMNLGRDLHLVHAAEPLLAPPAGGRWQTLWSSEQPRYGGCGAGELDTEDGWRIPGHATVVLIATREGNDGTSQQ
jgi:maltooligosyltrehalose trehalohydrolase